MAVGERERRELQEALVDTIGPDPTDTLLGYLPPVGWADVATQRDLENLETRLRGEIRHVDAKLDAVADRLDTKIDGLADRLDAKIDGLADRLDAKIDGVADLLGGRIDTACARLEGQLHYELHRQDRWLFAITITIAFGLLAQVLALLLALRG